MQLGTETPAIVTGGASGLGEATARMLAAAGCPVAILDRDETRGERVAAEIGGVFVDTDVADPASVEKSLNTTRKKQGTERLCICCAGIAPGAKTVGKEGPHDAQIFNKTIQINLLGVFNVASQSAAEMAKTDPLSTGERGVIINTSSIAAYEGQIGQLAYAASKGGVASMTLPMARDLSRSNIRVMAIAPGLFLTPMLQGLPQEVQDSLGKTVPYPDRLGDPAEFAALVRHIAENPMLNGEVIRLDGALRMSPK